MKTFSTIFVIFKGINSPKKFQTIQAKVWVIKPIYLCLYTKIMIKPSINMYDKILLYWNLKKKPEKSYLIP